MGFIPADETKRESTRSQIYRNGKQQWGELYDMVVWPAMLNEPFADSLGLMIQLLSERWEEVKKCSPEKRYSEYEIDDLIV